MSEPSDQLKPEKQSTYMVQDRNSEKELHRLTVQDHMITVGMGGVLPEQANATAFERILDIGSGSGSWVIETAQTYPQIELVGIDISQRMVEYAREQATEADVAARVEFQVMDALMLLDFPDNTFDLVNVRFGSSFVRKFEWRNLLTDMLRVTRPGGVVRVVEANVGVQSTSANLESFCEMIICAEHQSMRLFESKPDGVSSHMQELLEMHGYGCEQVQLKVSALEFRAGTPEGQAYCEDTQYAMQTMRPFIEKYGCLSKEYDTICQQAREEMQHPDFRSTWKIATVWGRKPE